MSGRDMSGAVVWITGRPSAGKSTLARRLADALRARGRSCLVLDGDEVRGAMVPAKGYSDSERDEQYATLSNLALLAARQGVVAIVAATAHKRAYRESCRKSAPRFVEVLVEVSLEEAARRDPKGLYRGVRLGTLEKLPGVDVAYEPPDRPECVAAGGGDEDAIRRIEALLDPS